MTLEEKEYYLMLPAYRPIDIEKLCDVKQSRASVIKEICRKKFGGNIEGRPNVTTAKAFWLYMGSSIEEELRLLGIAKGYGTKE